MECQVGKVVCDDVCAVCLTIHSDGYLLCAWSVPSHQIFTISIVFLDGGTFSSINRIACSLCSNERNDSAQRSCYMTVFHLDVSVVVDGYFHRFGHWRVFAHQVNRLNLHLQCLTVGKCCLRDKHLCSFTISHIRADCSLVAQSVERRNEESILLAHFLVLALHADIIAHLNSWSVIILSIRPFQKQSFLCLLCAHILRSLRCLVLDIGEEAGGIGIVG